MKTYWEEELYSAHFKTWL